MLRNKVFILIILIIVLIGVVLFFLFDFNEVKYLIISYFNGIIAFTLGVIGQSMKIIKMNKLNHDFNKVIEIYKIVNTKDIANDLKIKQIQKVIDYDVCREIK